MPQPGFEPTTSWFKSGALVHSATQILALKEWKVGFIKMFNHKPLLVSDDRSLLSCCYAMVQEIKFLCN
jgi:hypothetical protein